LAELEAFLSRWGKERYLARQISRWIYRRFAEDFSSMTDLSMDFRGELSRECRISSPPAERVEASSDGTEKYLFRLEDGESVESVLIPEEDRRTLCISSQVGCALACGFCATGAAGFRRNMNAAEIVHQVCFAVKRLEERAERLTNVVFMGMGEPLENPREVSRTIAILLSQFGFGLPGKRVTVSTAGVVPAMLALAKEYPVSFAVSINAPRDDLRSKLMPLNRKYPLKNLIAALTKIPLQSGRKVTAEYVLLAGVNDSERDAGDLARLLKGARVKVNLIPYNAHAYGDFTSPPAETVDRFRDNLLSSGIQTITRERRGRTSGGVRAARGAAEAIPLERREG
jgi:23S rRNA (adenine2503-C2)-methyltransferase